MVDVLKQNMASLLPDSYYCMQLKDKTNVALSMRAHDPDSCPEIFASSIALTLKLRDEKREVHQL